MTVTLTITKVPAVLACCEAELIAPGLLPYEMASICRTKMLRRPEEVQRWALSVYDAAYLQLALREGAALVTLDRRLAAAADAAAGPVPGRPPIL